MRTFEPGKSRRELGIDTSRKFVLVEPYFCHFIEGFKEGDRLEFLDDASFSSTGRFKKVGGKEEFSFFWDQLAYADEPETPYVPRVGDRVSVEGVVRTVSEGDGFAIPGVFISFDDSQTVFLRTGNMASVKFISRGPRTLTKSEAEALLKEKLGEDVTIE